MKTKLISRMIVQIFEKLDQGKIHKYVLEEIADHDQFPHELKMLAHAYGNIISIDPTDQSLEIYNVICDLIKAIENASKTLGPFDDDDRLIRLYKLLAKGLRVVESKNDALFVDTDVNDTRSLLGGEPLFKWIDELVQVKITLGKGGTVPPPPNKLSRIKNLLALAIESNANKILNHKSANIIFQAEPTFVKNDGIYQGTLWITNVGAGIAIGLSITCEILDLIDIDQFDIDAELDFAGKRGEKDIEIKYHSDTKIPAEIEPFEDTVLPLIVTIEEVVRSSLNSATIKFPSIIKYPSEFTFSDREISSLNSVGMRFSAIYKGCGEDNCISEYICKLSWENRYISSCDCSTMEYK